MRVLLDTHAVVWWMRSDAHLSTAARSCIASDATEVFVSVVSAWEIAIKVGLGKWAEARPYLDAFETVIPLEGFRLLPITIDHVRSAGLMTSQHRDPFDRLLAAQAGIEGLTLVTADAKVQRLGSPWLW